MKRKSKAFVPSPVTTMEERVVPSGSSAFNGLPVIMAAGPLTPDGKPLGNFGGVQRIIQSADSINFYYDVGQGSGFNRAVQITNRPHLPKDVRLYWGDAIGHWEGDTLVVDIANFSNETNFRGARENLHVLERYKRVDSNTLQVMTTVERRRFMPGVDSSGGNSRCLTRPRPITIATQSATIVKTVTRTQK